MKYLAFHWLQTETLANQAACDDPIWLCLTLDGAGVPQFQPAASPPTAVTCNPKTGI